MEKGVFIRPAVAGPLSKSYIESRLHMDWQDHVDADLAKIHKQLQRDFARSVAMPIYVIVDPVTGEMLRRFTLNDAGSASKDAWASAFTDFPTRSTD